MVKNCLCWILCSILFTLATTSNASSHSYNFQWDCLVFTKSSHSQSSQSYGKFYCMHKPTHRISPFYYCRNITKPHYINSPCSNSSIPYIVTTWNSWQFNPSLNLRYRLRNVIYIKSATLTGQKPKIVDVIDENLPDSQESQDPRWITGPWSACKQQSIINSQLVIGYARSSQHLLPMILSKRNRSVECLTYDGQSSNSCPIQSRPHTQEICSIGSQCKVSAWSRWSVCQPIHQTNLSSIGIQLRHRYITSINQDHEIDSCPSLIDRRLCQFVHKPKPSWRIGQWGLCQIRWPNLLSNKPQCGIVGWQLRSITCIDNQGHVVADKMCYHTNGQENKPVFNRLCMVECKRDCLVGPWSDWSSCCSPYRSISTRRRQILISPKQDGQACPPLTQTRNCSQLSCHRWFADKWSTCLQSSGNGQPYCRNGNKFRSVYCIDQHHNMVADNYCGLWRRPIMMTPCKLSCRNDCIISDWSHWQTERLSLIPIVFNSINMMLQRARQVRIRYILSSAGPGGKSCPYSPQLIQTMTVQRYLPIWITQPWSNCTCFADGCYQYRRVECVDYFEKKLAPISACQYRSRPLIERICHDPQQQHPLHCQLSPWSDWYSPLPLSSSSPTINLCNTKSANKRLRVVLQYHSVGGHPCPSNMTRNGFVVQYASLRNQSSCNPSSYPSLLNLSPTNKRFTWQVLSWQSCQLISARHQQKPLCGSGLQIRSVQCIDATNHLPTLNKHCINDQSLSIPAVFRQCFIPCQGDCSLTSWSNWSNCSQSCYRPRRTRIRYFINYNRQQGFNKCPQIQQHHLQQQSECIHHQHCFSYTWLPTLWSTCLLKSSTLNCGQGLQQRQLLCQRNDSVLVEDRLCHLYANNKPSIVRDCFIHCPIDCTVNSWSLWSPCQHYCGDSVRNRTRKVLQIPSFNGRPCPQLLQLEICQERLCHDIRWHHTTWSQCQFRRSWKRCGHGVQSRKVHCGDNRGQVLDDQRCLAISHKPSSVQSCHIACPGKCVYSMWTQWQPHKCLYHLPSINNRTSGKPQCRTRTVLRQTSQRYECLQPDLLFQQRYVDEDHFSWAVGPWTTCTTYPRARCGDGLQHRPIYCHNKRQQVVAISSCTTRPPHGVRSCRVDCDVDCVLSPWTDWSFCSQNCGLHGISTRQRSILFNATGIGRACPTSQQLRQYKSCNIRPCLNYTIVRSPWSKCMPSVRQCGHGQQFRSVTCLRHDGIFVDLAQCLNHQLTRSLNDANSTNQLTAGNLRQFFDVDLQRNCHIPCQHDCVVTNWSSYSPCYRDCNIKDSIPYRIRARHILRRNRFAGQKCPSNTIQMNNCSISQAQCAQFEWRTSPWHNGIRQVWCIDVHTGNHVSGCHEWSKPSTKQACDEICHQPYRQCQDGRCVCKNGTEGGGQICLPITGCFDNHHCPLQNMRCGNNRQCQCIDGYHMDCPPSSHCRCIRDREVYESVNCPMEIKTSTSGTIHLSEEPALASGCKRQLHLPQAHNITVRVEFFNHRHITDCTQTYLKLVPSHGKATILCTNLTGRHQVAFPVDSLLVDYHNRVKAVAPQLPTFVMDYTWDKCN